jgi:hypothetical protein
MGLVNTDAQEQKQGQGQGQKQEEEILFTGQAYRNFIQAVHSPYSRIACSCQKVF